MSRVANSAKTLTTSFLGDAIVYVLQFAVRTVFINTLGIEFLGIEGLFSNILSLLSLTELGFGTAITYRLYKPIAEEDTLRIRVLMKLFKYVYRGVGAVILIFGILCIPFLPVIINDYDSLSNLGVSCPLIFLLYLFQTVSTYLFFAYKSALVRAHQKTYRLNIVGYPILVLSMLARIVILVFARDFTLYVGIVIVFNIAQNFAWSVVADRLYRAELEPVDEQVSGDEVRELAKDCASLFLYKANGAVYSATDNIVISVILGLSSVGVYANYAMIHSALRNICNKVLNSTNESIGDLHARECGSDHEAEVFLALNCLTFLLYGAVAVGLFVILDDFVSLWVGSEYTLGLVFTVPFCLELYLQGNSQLLNRFRVGMGLFQKAKYRPLASMLANLVVSVQLVPILGIAGVVYGTLFAQLFIKFWCDAYIIWKFGFRSRKRMLLRYFLSNLGYMVVLGISGGVGYLICGCIPVDGWFGVVVHGLTGVVIFFAIALTTTVRTAEFKALVPYFRRLKEGGKRLLRQKVSSR